MIHLAKEDIKHSLGKFIVTAMGVGMLLGIVLIMVGVYRGMIADAEVLLDDLDVDLWIVQEDTLGPFAEASRVHEDLKYTIKSINAIDKSEAITFQNLQLPLAKRKLSVVAIGYDIYGNINPINPKRLIKGRMPKHDHYEIVVSDKTLYKIGDKIPLGRNSYTVVGITHGTVASNGDPLVYLSLKDGQELQFTYTNKRIQTDRAQAIKAEHLSKHFGKGDSLVDVIDDASFTINKGELVALIAPSGAGKTTLLMMLGCVVEPSAGTIWIGDEKVYDNKWLTKETRKIRREKIGFIFQAHYLIPFLNIMDNLILLPQTNGVDEKDSQKKARELLTYFDIADKENAMPSQLSGGQNQRVAIARALMNNPEIILADEPTAALDTERSVDVVKLLKKIAIEQDVAIIMVTHDERMLPYCDRIMKIEHKRIVFENSDQKSQKNR